MNLCTDATRIKTFTAKLAELVKEAPHRSYDLHRIVSLAVADKVLFPEYYPAGVQAVSSPVVWKDRNCTLLGAFAEFFRGTDWDFYEEISFQLQQYLKTIAEEELLHVPGLLHEAIGNLLPDGEEGSSKRKKTGSYYTPGYIVRYMVERSMGYLAQAPLTGESLYGFKALDPSCGGGSFLVEIYRWLTRQGVPSRTAMHSVYGTDINRAAVDLTVYVLTVAVMAAGCGDEGVREIKLALEQQVRQGNALTALRKHVLFRNDGSEIPMEFNWQNEFPEVFSPAVGAEDRGFHLVAGNPPYVSNKLISADEKEYCCKHFSFARGQFDLAVPFVEQGLNLLRDEGILCYITSNKFLAADYGVRLRTGILEDTRICELTDVSTLNCFEGTSAYPVIITVKKKKPALPAEGTNPVQIFQAARWSDLAEAEPTIVEQNMFGQNFGYLITPQLNRNILPVIIKLAKVKGAIPQQKIRCGLAQTGFKRWIVKSGQAALGSVEDHLCAFVQAGHIKPFAISGYDYIDTRRFKADRWAREKGPKLVVPGIARKLVAAIDYNDCILGRVYYIRDGETEFDLHYLAVLLNSYVLNFCYKIFYWPVHLEGGYLRFNSGYLANMPVPGPGVSEKEAESNDRPAIGKIAGEIRDLGYRLIAEKSGSDLVEIRNLAEARVFNLYGFNRTEAETIMGFLEIPLQTRSKVLEMMEGN